MTKQEFAIKLLFWLTPWPISKQLPKFLGKLLDRPPGTAIYQWAQATHDALTKFLTDATDYAQKLFDIIPDIPPTDQLIETAAALTNTIENANSALATLTATLSNVMDYTPQQLWNAILAALNLILDLVSTMDALLAVIEEIRDNIPDIPPIPEPPPYEPPIPPIYPPGPGPGQPGPLYPPRKPRARAQWVAHFDNTNWESEPGYPTEAIWDEEDLIWFPDNAAMRLNPIGTWATAYRPTKMRITWLGPFSTCVIRLSAAAGDLTIGTDITYTSGDDIILDFTEGLDFDRLTFTNIWDLWNIEFYEE